MLTALSALSLLALGRLALCCGPAWLNFLRGFGLSRSPVWASCGFGPSDWRASGFTVLQAVLSAVNAPSALAIPLGA